VVLNCNSPKIILDTRNGEDYYTYIGSTNPQENEMHTFQLIFTQYGNFGRNYNHTFTVQADSLEQAICSVEAANPSLYFRGETW
jgi:hypothetical protein